MLDAYPLGNIETNRSAWEGKSWGTLGGETIFASESGIYGRELWATDGTESGTRLVRDIYPGSGSSLSASQAGTRVDELLLFQASDGVHGLQLWKTDGSTAGTSSMADWLEEPGLATARLFAQTDAALYLSVETADVLELWSTDGTPAGTHHLANGPTPGWAIQLVGVVGNTLLFGLDDGEHGYEVWRTDGSPEGTFLLRDIAEGAESSTRFPHDFLGVYDGTGFFMASNAEFGAELWRTDGTTEGTQVLIDASPGNASSSLAAGEPLAVTSFGLFFWLRSSETGAELYRTDGTPTGTELLKDIRPGTSGSLRNAEAVTVADSWVAFTADDGVDRDALWITDGSSAGTFKLLGAPQGGELQALLSAELLGSIDSRIVFTVKGDFGRELWSTDGTIAGTQSLGALNAEREPFAVLEDGSILFVSEDSVSGEELWRTNGTPEGTVRVSDICPGACHAQLWSGPLGWLGDQLYFSAYDPTHGKELWAIDRWGGNLRLVVDAVPGPDSLMPLFQTDIAQVGSRLLFEGRDATHGSEVWYTDGTAAGTGLLKDFQPGPEPRLSTGFSVFATLPDRLLLHAQTDIGFALWETDGTPDGTRAWQDFRSGSGDANPQNLIAANGQVFFHGSNVRYGSQLWALPGTGGAPFGLADHVPTYYGDSLKSVAELDGWLYFVNLEQGRAPLLYRTQGTPASTALIAVLSPGDGAVARTRRELVTVGDRLFIAVQGDSPNEGYGALWSSDGTSAGTVRLGVGQFMSVDELTPVGDRLFFTANRGGGPELWVTDGLPAGTRKLKDLCSPRNCTGRFGLTEADGKVYFASKDNQYGMELWRSDGTLEGTSLVANIGSGITSGLSLESTRSMASLNGDLYFVANDGPHGFEPWVLRAGAAAPTMLADLRPGFNAHSFLNGVTGQFTPVGDQMYFLSRDGLWKTSEESPTIVQPFVCKVGLGYLAGEGVT